MAVAVKIIQVVGFQNSGKTTLVSKLVRFYTGQGLQVGTIKRHGHSANLLLGDSKKDSGKHRAAGAVVTSAQSSAAVNIVLQNDKIGWSLEQLISFYKQLPLDIILVEGYKEAAFPKIVMLRSEQDLLQLATLPNIVCFFSSVPQHLESNRPIFYKNEEQLFLQWLDAFMKEGYNG